MPSFNPCFCGSGLGSLSQVEKTYYWLCFNPCFCGSGLGRIVRPAGREPVSLVSILVFVEVVWEVIDELEQQVKAAEFQSLFLWKWFGKTAQQPGYQMNIYVSILVFVEVVWEERLILNRNLIDVCFNPCFCGSGLGRV